MDVQWGNGPARPKVISLNDPPQSRGCAPTAEGSDVPSFTKVVTPSSYSRGGPLTIPSHFSRVYATTSGMWTLLTNETSWEVRVLVRLAGGQTKCEFLAGWRDFLVSNGIQEGDELLFQLVRPETLQVTKIRSASAVALASAPHFTPTSEPGQQPSGVNTVTTHSDGVRRWARVPVAVPSEDANKDGQDSDAVPLGRGARAVSAAKRRKVGHTDPHTAAALPSDGAAGPITPDPKPAATAALVSDRAPRYGGITPATTTTPAAQQVKELTMEALHAAPTLLLGTSILLGPPYHHTWCVGTVESIAHAHPLLYHVRFVYVPVTTDQPGSGNDNGRKGLGDGAADVTMHVAGAAALAAAQMIAPGCFTGSTIHKEFEGRRYRGTVLQYNSTHQWYQVRYEDGDKEDLTAAEVVAHLPGPPAQWDAAVTGKLHGWQAVGNVHDVSGGHVLGDARVVQNTRGEEDGETGAPTDAVLHTGEGNVEELEAQLESSLDASIQGQNTAAARPFACGDQQRQHMGGAHEAVDGDGIKRHEGSVTVHENGGFLAGLAQLLHMYADAK